MCEGEGDRGRLELNEGKEMSIWKEAVNGRLWETKLLNFFSFSVWKFMYVLAHVKVCVCIIYYILYTDV